MALFSGLVLDQLICALNAAVSSEERAARLNRLKTLCEEAVVNRVKTVEDREVFVCDFSKLQLPKAEEARSLNHVPVR